MLTAMPFTGHVTPVLAVAAALVTRGHDVRLYTGRAFSASAERIGARFVPWRQAPDFDEHDLPATFPRLLGKRGIAQLLVNMEDLFINTAAGQVADLEAEWAREPWDVHVGEEVSIGPRLFTERTGCRWATLTVLPLYLASKQGPPAGLGLVPGTNPITTARDAVLRGLAPVLSRPLRAPVARQRAALGLPPSSETFNDAIFSPELILATGVPALDYGRVDRPPRLHWVGALQPEPPRQMPLPAWWGDMTDQPVVVVTQGTFNLDPADLLRPALEALDGLDVRVIALAGVPGRDALPFPVPSNVRVAGFLPFEALLPRTSAMITNGGWGGTLRALRYGIPLVLAGGDLDKPEVAARVASAGAGIDLRGARPTAASVRSAYDRITRDGSFATAARRIAADLAEAGGARRAAELLEAFARP
jgi:UDP:flavonoid glycosyltransferase YjiC (YdhE family)